ncbi:hypothetical protein PV326_002532 [Microctonus aethiopoides]|nr:hypothetical protein PV326_002532 [Microctonus aethiopoides]
MNTQIRHPYEGQLHKYTNAMKGWQYRWFILSPETGELHYFLSESEKNQRPRCSIYLAGAVIAPSDEDSNTFTVNSATGDMIKLRATDARARQEWVDKLRAITEMYTRAIASSHPPLPPREHSTNSNRHPVTKLEVLDAFANCREQLNKMEKQNQSLSQLIESSSLYLDPDLLTLKAIFIPSVCTPNTNNIQRKRQFRGRSELITKCAEVKVIMTTAGDEKIINDTKILFTYRTNVSMTLEDNEGCGKKSCGFHLTRSKWDPYPWVGYVEAGSVADISGLRAGDCLLDINGVDIVGLRVKEIASLIKKEPGITINLQVWRNNEENNLISSDDGAALSGPLPTLARKLAKAVSGAVRALECPVCLETAMSPVSQCVHGHILCVNCRTKTPRCPVCRVRLGQGRCLLADEVQRNIREAFEDSRMNLTVSNSNCSLKEKLFGKIGIKTENSSNEGNLKVNNNKSKPSLARLLFGGFDKAVSAENLAVSNLNESRNFSAEDASAVAYRRLGELSQNDRAKSASTGELSRNDEARINESLQRLVGGKVYTSSSGHLSVPQTPTWGGSTESVSNNSFLCPLANKSLCREPLNYDNFMEHLGRNHSSSQIHFYGPKALIPIPLPFASDSAYIFHHLGELFFFQYEEEAAWVTGTVGKGEWILHGWSADGTEMKLRRPIAKIDSIKPPLCYLAPLPQALCITFVDIELIHSQPEALEV